MSVRVRVKWKTNAYDVELLTTEPLLVFKSQLFSLTGVPPERQKLMYKGLLKDDVDLSQLNIPEGSNILMIGSDQVVSNTQPVKFIEDLPPDEKDTLMGIRVFKPKSMGLVNLGNTCYFNSVIQFLLPVNELWEKLKLFNSIPDRERNSFISSLILMSDALLNGNKPYIPSTQVLLLRQLYPTFNKIDKSTGQYMQQDAEECLNFILNTMNDFTSSSIADEIFGYTLLVKTEKYGANDEVKLEKDACKHMFLRCIMGSQSNPISTVKDGIKESMVQTVTLNNDGTEEQYVKTSYLTSLPEYLIIHLVRFEWKQASSTSMTQACKAKVCRRVSFEKNLDISFLCEKELEKKLSDINSYAFDLEKKITPSVEIEPGSHKNGVYTLKSVVTHQGRTADGGHYLSWVRTTEEDSEDKKANGDFWYKFDDDDISKLEYDTIDLCGGRSDYHIAVLLLYKAEYIHVDK